MGKKYIIELERGTHIFVLGPEGITHIGEPDVVYETVDGMQIGDAVINAKPYTEPDLEQVRKEAYDEGYDDAKGGYENGFENGMIVAWEAARKIIRMPEVDLLNLFTECYSAVCTSLQVFLKYDASEVIEKIRKYEQEKEEQITKGDVVRIKSAPEIEILVTCADEDHVSGIALTEMDDCCEIGDQYTDIVIHKVEKTGKHYDIAEVLRKMRENSDG